MDAPFLSRASSFSHLDADVSFMDTSQDFEPSQGCVVRWVASQSTNPALQALMREAERDRRTRPSTPVDEPVTWTYPLTSMTSPTSLSASVSSAWHSSGRNSAESPHPPLSGSSSSTSSESLVSTRAQPPPTAQRRPLASSTSSANQLPCRSVRPRSSSHSTRLSPPSASKEKYTPRDDEPEAKKMLQLIEVTCSRADQNSEIKQQVVRAKRKPKERGQSLEKSGTDNDHTKGLDTSIPNTRPLTKTTSASAVYPVTLSTKAPEKTLTTSLSARKPEHRGRIVAQGPSFAPPGVHPVSGKSTPTSLPSSNFNCDPKPVPIPRLPDAKTSNASNSDHSATRKTCFSEPTPNGGDTAMQDVIELTDSDTECKKPPPGLSSRADIAMCMDLDDEESDSGMDVSFYKPEPPPRSRIPAPKPGPQPPSKPSTASRLAAPTQRTRTTGPPPLGMRRAPHIQPSQYGSTQGPKPATVPRFKPPLLTNAGGTTTKNGSGTMLPSTSSPRPPTSRGNTAKVFAAEMARAVPKDPDSSFDVSFDVDADALEEAMKAYD